MSEESLIELIPISKKSYRILFDKKEFTIKTPFIKLPFGYELYNNKYLLNMELYTVDKNNKMYNFHCIIKHMETLVEEKAKTMKELKNKNFVSSLKTRKFPILRTHLKMNKYVTANIVDMKKNLLSIKDLKKNTYGYFDIILKELWIHKDDYGIIWIVRECMITKN